MKIDRAGIPFVVAALAPALVLSVVHLYAWAVPFGCLAVALVFFFRDPERRPPTSSRSAVISPADGKVMVAGAPQPDAAPPGGPWTQLSIFLSPLDVHVNRMPVSGRVTKVDYRRGRYHAAYKAEATLENERSEVWLEGPGWTVVCRQITGVLVRRVVCRAVPGDEVLAGDRFGVMKFGSRIDLFLPAGTPLKAAIGDRVTAGESIVAELMVEEGSASLG